MLHLTCSHSPSNTRCLLRALVFVVACSRLALLALLSQHPWGEVSEGAFLPRGAVPLQEMGTHCCARRVIDMQIGTLAVGAETLTVAKCAKERGRDERTNGTCVGNWVRTLPLRHGSMDAGSSERAGTIAELGTTASTRALHALVLFYTDQQAKITNV